MDIHDANLSFRGSLSRRSATRRIILHHAEATSCSPQQIHQCHLDNGWAGAGYHFLVRKDGSVYSLRPEWAVGSHAQGSNSDSIGICFEGNYMRETMPDAQRRAGAELVSHLKSKYGIQTVLRHKQVCSTDCPGVNFPFDAIANGSVAGWVKDSKGWWYRNSDGTYPKSKWVKLDAWYWFDEKGYAIHNTWKKLGGFWYWFGSDCRMKTGWVKLKGLWYYLNPKKDGNWPEGSARTGWLTWKGKKYYLRKKADGGVECSMATGSIILAGKTYKFDSTGALVS